MRRTIIMIALVASGCWGDRFKQEGFFDAPDAGAQEDAGEPDAELEDAGEPDAELEDAGEPDAELEDAGEPDAELEDAGEPDAELEDAGPSCSCHLGGDEAELVKPCPEPCNCEDTCEPSTGADCLTCNTFQPLVTCSVCRDGFTCEDGVCR